MSRIFAPTTNDPVTTLETATQGGSRSPSTVGGDNDTKQKVIFASIVTAVYATVLAIGITRHEMWGDEFQAWLVARDSTSVSNLLQNLRYEGSPPLWHICLFALTQFTHDPLAMQIFHGLIAVGCVYLVTRFAPFNWYVKAMFPFGYFMLFEYGLISRSYALGNLFLFSFCVLFAKKPRRYLFLYGLLTLLALTSVHGAILATALGIGLLSETIFENKNRLSSVFERSRKKLLVGLVLFFLSLAAVVAQVAPPPDGYMSNWQKEVAKKFELRSSTAARDLSRSAGTVLYSYLPIPSAGYNFWETSFFRTDYFSLSYKLALFSVALFVLFSVGFAAQRMVFISYVLGTFGVAAFSYLFLTGAMRHFGQLFTLLFACFWLAPFCRSWSFKNKSASFAVSQTREWTTLLLTVMLALHMVYGIYCYAMDFKWPFSQSKEIAGYLVAKGFDKTPIIVGPDRNGTGICALLDRKVEHIETGKLGSFVESRPSQALRSAIEFVRGAEKHIRKTGVPTLVFARWVPGLEKLWSLKITFLQLFQGSILEPEDLVLYLVWPEQKVTGNERVLSDENEES